MVKKKRYHNGNEKILRIEWEWKTISKFAGLG